MNQGSHETFIAALARFDADIAKALLQPSLIGFASEANAKGAQSGGSLARANTTFQSFMIIIEDIQRSVAASAVNSQIIPQLVDLNFPNVKNYPVFKFGRLDQSKELELFTVWSGLVSGKIVAPILDDQAHIRKALGMPENDDPQELELPSDAAAQATADAAQAKIAKPDDAQSGDGPGRLSTKARRVPKAELSEEMAAYAEAHDAVWVTLGEETLCVDTAELAWDP